MTFQLPRIFTALRWPPEERVVVFGYKKFYTVDQNGQETQGQLAATQGYQGYLQMK